MVGTIPATTVAEETSTLTALDRCDSCGAQAYIKAELDSGELLFCAHHGHLYEAKLRPNALSWVDESHKLHADS